MANKSEDITKTGPVGLKGIRGTDLYNKLQTGAANNDEDYLAILQGLSSTKPTPYTFGNAEQYFKPVEQKAGSLYEKLGDSIYDDPYVLGEDPTVIDDIRGERQPWYSQLFSGIGKGVALAGTTFLDGTLGLVYGASSAVVNGDVSKLWDNEISNGLQEFNREMEKWLPNYRTSEEQNNAWYENLGTVNFWADSFIKNLGFTVGALYSGGVITKGLKAVKLLKNTSTLGAKLTGALFSAVNEGRIEANHTTHDLKELHVQQALDAATKAREEVLNNAFLSEEERLQKLEEIDNNYNLTLAQIDDNLKKAGLTDFIANVPILTLSNFWTFGRFYGQGFHNAATVAGNNVTKNSTKEILKNVSKAANEAATAAENTLIQNIKKVADKYVWNTITNKKAIGKGFLTGLIEGNEEMSQALASEFAGNYHFYKDSPDAYYRAMTDPKALQETSDAWSALATGFVNTYGNGDRYEEFAVGFLTGILGTPTFGSSQNASANTWIGRNKFFGMSGGILGEMAVAKEENAKGLAHVQHMNKLLEKINKNKGLMAASKKYTDAMHAWAEEKDAFEYKNNEDNEDWRGITSFLSTGRKADLMDLIDQDFESASDEELEAIAAFTTPDGSNVGSGGWRDASGHLITAESSQEDKDKMRKSLADKRDKLKKNISEYEKSLSFVRNLVNGSDRVSEDEVNELAWLHWKMGRFTDRYNSIISNEVNKNAYMSLDAGLNAYERALQEQAEATYLSTEGLSSIDKARAEAVNAVTRERATTASKALENVKNLRAFLQSVISAKGDRQQIFSAKMLKSNLDVLNNLMQDDALYEDFIAETGIPREDLNESLRQLQDLGRLSQAFSQFNDRFSEFVQDPNKQRANRKKIDDENAEIQESVNESAKRKKARNISIEELKEKDNSELEDILNSLDENNPNDAEKINSVREEIKKRKTGEAIRNSLRAMEQEALDNEDEEKTIAIQAALEKLEQAQAAADNSDELRDLDNEIYHGLGRLEAQDGLDSSVEEEAFNALAQAIDAGISAIEDSEKMSASAPAENTDSKTGEVITPTEEKTSRSKETGHDPVASTPAVNSPAKKPERRKTKAEKNAERAAKKAQKNKEKAEKRKKEEQAKKEGERKKAVNQVVINAATEILSTISDKVDITEEIFARTLDLVSHIFTELEGIDSIEEANALLPKLAAQDEWKDFKEAVKVPIDDELLVYALNYIYSLNNSTNESEEEDSESNIEKRVGIQTQTPDINIDSNDYEILDGTPLRLGSWMSLVREFPIHGKDTTPYHKTEAFKDTLRNKLIQKGLKGKELEKAIDAEVKRLTAVYDYLKLHNAFSNASKVVAPKGRQQGTKVHFVIDPALNTTAGETVILMSTDPEGKNIIGAVRGNNEIVKEQTHLQPFINRTVDEYNKHVENTNDSSSIWTSPETTHVAQTLPGRVMFSEKSYSLNDIYKKGTDTNSGTEDFMLGIYMPDSSVVMTSRTKKGNRSAEERKVRTPYRRAVPGQPFLMVPTGEGIGRYIPVPIHMNLFGPQMSGSKFATWVLEHIKEAWNDKALNQKTTQTNIKLALEDLFSHEFHVNIQGGKFKVSAVMKDGKQRNFYEVSLINASVEGLMRAITIAGLGIQINRKYINDTINIAGQEVKYNEVIGEIAATNIAPGFGHTVNDFFTLNPINGKKQEESAEKLKGKEGSSSNEDAEVNKIQVTVDKTVYYLREDDKITDASGKVITVDDLVEYRIKAAAEIIKKNKVSIDDAHPNIYLTSYGYYDVEKSVFVTRESIENNNSTEVITPENISDYVQVTITSNGMGTVYPINNWNRKVKDLRTDASSSGWGTYSGITYYILYHTGGRRGDNVTIWFKNDPSPSIKKQIELFLDKSATINEKILANILNGKIVYTDSSTDIDNTSSGQTEVPAETTTVERNTSIEDDSISSEEIDAAMSDRSEGTKVKTFAFSSKKTDSTESAETKPSSDIPSVFNTKQLKEMFNALSPEQQAAIRSLKSSMQRQVMTKLKLFYKNGKFTTDVDSLIKPTRHRIAENKGKQSNLEKELEWLDKVLPQLSREQKVAIVEGLIKVSGSSTPLYAWGKFQDGIITLSSNAAKGTVFHEAFHFVSQTLLSDRELDTLYTEGAKKYKIQDIDEIEELLAEDYRKYVQLEQIPILGSAVKIFRALKHRVQAFIGNESYINNLFYRISKGEFANKKTPTLEKPIVKAKYKGKLIFAQSGTGKTTIADNETLIDGDYLLARVLGVETALAATAFNTLSNAEKKTITKKYHDAIRAELDKGNTVVTTSSVMLKEADVIIYNSTPELANERTSGFTRTNKLNNLNYHQSIIKSIQEIAKTSNKEVIALSRNKYLGNIILENSNYNRFKDIVDKGDLSSLIKKYLNNFGIEVSINPEVADSFIALDRLVSVSEKSKLPEDAGRAIAFMMQFNPNIKSFIVEWAKEDGKLSSSDFTASGKVHKKAYESLDKTPYINILGDIIGEYLNRLYDNRLEKSPSSMSKKIWTTITDFFKIISENKRVSKDLRNTANYIAYNILVDNTALIRGSVRKPGDEDKGAVSKVNVSEALDNNPYERDLILNLTSTGQIALAGSAAMALQGTIYRPAENPLHDLDFNTFFTNSVELESFLNSKLDNVKFVRTIDIEDQDSITYTYLTFNRPFHIVNHSEIDSKEIAVNKVIDDLTGETIATFSGSNLIILKDGVQGKFLDFFVDRDPNNSNVQMSSFNYRGSNISVTYWKKSMEAKLVYNRLKDLFDYNRFIPNTFTSNSTSYERSRERLSTAETEEMKSIKEDAIANSTFMKAPNGNPTNLTERQWLQVRTKAFKDWFGDWENDPENASKVVDENGEPLVVYHGTEFGNFTIFKNGKVRATNGGSYAVGAFTTTDLNAARRYANIFNTPDTKSTEEYKKQSFISKLLGIPAKKTPNSERAAEFAPKLNSEANKYDYVVQAPYKTFDKGVYSLFLSIKNPKIVDYNGAYWNTSPEEIKNYYHVQIMNTTTGKTEIIKINSLEEGERYLKDYISKFESSSEDLNTGKGYIKHQGIVGLEGYHVKNTKTDEYYKITLFEERVPNTVNGLASNVREEGYDGLIVHNIQDANLKKGNYAIDEFIPFTPNQIKSATENVGTFDYNNPDIRYRLIDNEDLPTKEEMISAVQKHVNDYITESYNQGYTSRHAAINRWGLLVDNYRRRGFIIKAKNPTLRGRLDLTITDVKFSPELQSAMKIKENRQKKFAYKYLSTQQKERLRSFGINEWTYNTMTDFEKEEFWRCRR